MRRQATAGFFGALGSAVAGFARAAWTVTLFLIKAAVLIGVAYAGWEWLQSRRQNQFWSTPSYTPPTSGGPGGSDAAGNAYGSGSDLPLTGRRGGLGASRLLPAGPTGRPAAPLRQPASARRCLSGPQWAAGALCPAPPPSRAAGGRG